MGSGSSVRLLSLGVFVLATGAIGLMCLFFPGTVQAYAKSLISRDRLYGGKLVRNFVLSRGYVIAVRSVGVVALLMSSIALWAGIRAH